jgi:hypothetical protein
MKSGTFLPVLLALVVGVAIGWLVFRPAAAPPEVAPAPVPAPAPPPPPPPRAHPRPNLIIVGPAAKDVKPPTQHLSESANDQATWVLVDSHQALQSAKKLYIEFEKPSPFPDADLQQNGRYRVPCLGIVCQSGPIDANAPAGNYKYWQVLVDPDGKEETADGMIIIEK